MRQGIAAGLGAVAFVVATLVPPSLLQRYWRVLYLGTIGMMVFVFAVAPAIRGSRRWLVSARSSSSRRSSARRCSCSRSPASSSSGLGGSARSVRSLTAVGLGAIPLALVFVQPDFGTAMVYVAALAAVLFVAGTRWLHLALLGVFAALLVVSVLWLLPAAGVQVLKPYQTQANHRLHAPVERPERRDVQHHAVAHRRRCQAARRVAASPGRARPASTTSRSTRRTSCSRRSPSSAVSRRLDPAAALSPRRLARPPDHHAADDLFSATVAGGIVFAFLFQVFVNVGMTMGVAPVTGIPLPFVTVGGSSMVANLLAVGVLQSIHARGRLAPWR